MRPIPTRLALLAVLALAATLGVGAPAADRAKEGMVTRADLEIVDCLLPGQVRMLGSTTYLSARRPVRTNAADCRIRGGEYVAYDRADYKSALRVWMDMANAGDPEAETNVGEIYERGLGGTPNYDAALIWYRKVVDNKDLPDAKKSRALFNLGTLYEQGLGVEQDPLQAMNYYRRAWGVPEGNLMYTAARDREIEGLRKELESAIAEKNQQIELMNRQIQELQKKSSSDASALQHLVSKLAEERAASQQRLDAMPRAAVAAVGAVAAAGTREPQAQAVLPMATQTGAGVKVGNLDFGRYYALIIGNQNYDQLEALQTPRHDAERAAKILQEKYGFTVQVIEDANDVAMLKALNDLNGVLKPNDNLLIYYAGHGYRLKSDKLESGYWLPRNADRPPNDTFWVPNEQITSHIGRLAARRILVVADSCYAGLDKTNAPVSQEYLTFKLPKRARLLIASGGDNPVLDAGGDGHSVFAKAFLDALEGNDAILTAPALFSLVQGKVREGALRNHFAQTPEYKSIKGAGHEVGDFFFVPVSRTHS
jgi:uncharacterized coiled-coil protein SlyX